MAHHPVNHPARPVYRAVGGLTGLYLVAFGALGVVETRGTGLFVQDDSTVLWQGTNLGSAVLLGLIGLLALVGVGIGRNVDAVLNRWLGYLLIAVGLGALALVRTDVNYLNFTPATCMVTMVVGVVLLMSGLYSRVGSEEEARAWREATLKL